MQFFIFVLLQLPEIHFKNIWNEIINISNIFTVRKIKTTNSLLQFSKNDFKKVFRVLKFS